MTKTKTIKVMQKDIKDGIRIDSKLCPVALAMNRAFRKVNINVAGPYFCYNVGENIKRIELPIKVAKFVSNFDSAEEVKPFSFVVKIPTA